MSTAAVLLCAGAGSRYTGPSTKLLAPYRGKPLVSWSSQAALAAGLDETLVVVGAAELGAALPGGVRVLVNRRWQDGLASSLACAIAACAAAGHEAAVVGLGDQPLVRPAAWSALAAAGCAIAVATYDGARGHPVRLARGVWELLPVVGDVGARAVMRAHPELVEEVPCEGDPVDLDRLEDFALAT